MQLIAVIVLAAVSDELEVADFFLVDSTFLQAQLLFDVLFHHDRNVMARLDGLMYCVKRRAWHLFLP